MKIASGAHSVNALNQTSQDLIRGKIPKLASKQVDNVDDVNFKDAKRNHRVSMQYNKELDGNIAHVIDNATGKTVKTHMTESQVDQAIRIKRLMKLHIDEEA